MIPYAGFDPEEPTLEEIRKPQPKLCHPFWDTRSKINGEECLKLKEAGMTWREVGIEVARRLKRKMPFTVNTVFFAAKRYKADQ